ncbi:MAG: transglutaminase family protein [Ignavibacteria bacterium]|jgi:regulator of sirC expression with transglutaminase-like and TPR domain
MKTLFTLIFLLSVNFCFAQKQYTGQNIEDILKLSEDEINIGIASLVLAKEFYPNLNVQFFLQAFDYLADRYKYYFGKYTSPDDRIGALNTYLYKPGFWNDSITFSYDDDDLQVVKLDNKFINGYIANKKGSCITMPMLYVILGERLGLPIYPVRSAKHFFVRYEPEEFIINFQNNIEATNGGGFISNQQYQEDVLIPEKAIKNGVYLRTLTKKEYIATLLLTNANEYIKQRNIEKAKYYFQLAIKYDPTMSSAYWNYGLIAYGEARQLEEKMWEEKQRAIAVNNLEVRLTNKKRKEESYLPELKKNSQNEPRKNIQFTPKLLSEELLQRTEPQAKEKNNQIDERYLYQTELQDELMDIEKKYKPLILEKIALYKEYTNKAEELGIVHEFPIEFFEKQVESIKKYKQQGGY